MKQNREILNRRLFSKVYGRQLRKRDDSLLRNIELSAVSQKARKETFLANLPITVLQGNTIVKIYADNRKEIIGHVNSINTSFTNTKLVLQK